MKKILILSALVSFLTFAVRAGDVTNTTTSGTIEVPVIKTESNQNDSESESADIENYDQKANQIFFILSGVLKSIHEMASSVTRNIN